MKFEFRIYDLKFMIQDSKFEFVNGGRVLSAKDNNESKSWNLYVQSSKGVTADAWKYAIKCV